MLNGATKVAAIPLEIPDTMESELNYVTFFSFKLIYSRNVSNVSQNIAPPSEVLHAAALPPLQNPLIPSSLKIKMID